MTDRLKISDVIAADLPDWRMIQNKLHSSFDTGSFVAGLTFVEHIAEAAEAANHHPDITLTYPSVAVTLWSHDADGVTQRDIDLAIVISGLARAAGHEATPGRVLVDMGLDSHDGAAVAPFWAAILDGKVEGDEVLTDAGTPDVWFQQAEELPEPPPQRWHPDVWVAHDQAEARVQAALDAGGRLVSDDRAPSFWVLADGQGNKVCICTNLER